jgi:hypothetical protein
MSEEEILHKNRIEREQDEFCNKIKNCLCFTICISTTIYLIAMIIMISLYAENLGKL